MTSYTTNRYYRVTLTILSERTGTNSEQDHPVMLDYAKNVFQLSQGENNLTPCCVGTAFFTDVLRLNIAYEKYFKKNFRSSTVQKREAPFRSRISKT